MESYFPLILQFIEKIQLVRQGEGYLLPYVTNLLHPKLRNWTQTVRLYDVEFL